MANRPVFGDVALASVARTVNATSGPIAAAGQATLCVVLVHCTAATGTNPTLDIVLEGSADNVTYAPIAASGITQLTTAGNRVSGALVTTNYVRVAATIGGTTPSFTFSASVLFVPAG